MRRALSLASFVVALALAAPVSSAPRVQQLPAQPARPPSIKADADLDLSKGVDTVFSVKRIGAKFVTVARSKAGTVSPGKTSSGTLFVRVTDHASPAFGQSYGEADIGPELNDPAKLVPVDATLDGSGALFVGWFSDSLAGRQDFQIAKYLPVQGQQPVVTPVFKVLSRDQNRGRNIVPDEQGGVYVRGFGWDPAFNVQKAVPYTRHYSATGEKTWEKLGDVMPAMGASALTDRPLVLLGVGDGNGGIFEVQNIAGSTAQNNFDPTKDRIRIVHRNADGSVVYDTVVAVTAAAAMVGRMNPTAGGVTQIFRGPHARPVLVVQTNKEGRKIVDVAADGKTRAVATIASNDHVVQAGDGSIVVVSHPKQGNPRMTFKQLGVVEGKLQPTKTTSTPELPAASWVAVDDDAHVSISANGVVVIASSDHVVGRLAAATLAGKFIGAVSSPSGTDMLVNDGKRWFGYALVDAGWVYKGGAIDLGYAPPVVSLPN